MSTREGRDRDQALGYSLERLACFSSDTVSRLGSEGPVFLSHLSHSLYLDMLGEGVYFLGPQFLCM